MSIQANISIPVTDLQAEGLDSLVFDIAFRSAITAFSLHNTTAADREIYVYISPDTSSAAGDRVAVYTLAPDESVDVNELLGQGLGADENIVCVQQTAGSVIGDVNCKLTYQRYDGNS